MKYFSLALLFFCLFFKTSPIFSQGWTNLNTGINDNLTGVVFWNNYGILSGEQGLYFTTNGGNGPSSWMRYSISSSSTSDSITYNNTQFYHCYTNPDANTPTRVIFACGRDTVANKAVIIRISLPSFSYSIIYVGTLNSSLQNMGFNSYNDTYYAVGDSGLILSFDSLSSTIVDTSMTHNFSSIHFAYQDFLIGTSDVLIKGRDDLAGFNYTIHGASGIDNKDVLCTNQNAGYTVGSRYFQANTSGSLTEQTYYDFGLLNANAIKKKSYYFFVGTNHGIYRSPYNNYSILEWMPTAGSLAINDFWVDDNNATQIYACGKNGVLLVSNDNGGSAKPYVELNVSGRCVNTNVPLSGVTGTSSSCGWYIDGVQVSTGCNVNWQSFNTTGTYEIKLIGFNNGLLDTSIQYINIVDPPLINPQVSILDSLLCHQEPILITIDSAQQDVFYILKRFGQSTEYGSSPIGNDSSLTFSSNYLNQAGNYHLQAKSTLAECYNSFLDTIRVDIEKTKAEYHVGIVNATVNESVPFFQNCGDATNFNWSFSPNASINNTISPDPVNTFSSVGPTQVTLRCWSDAGCMDSIIGAGPTIYTAPTQVDSCWINANDGEDGTWTGFYYADIFQMSPSRSGYYICGDFNDIAFATQQGDSVYFDNTGGYMAKYDFDGTIKWTVRTIQTISARDNMRSVTEDNEGNVYICGNTSSYFIDNSGDSTKIGNNNNGTYIIKLDSFGQRIWHMRLNGIAPLNLEVDNSNNLVMSGLASNYWQEIEYLVNDSIVDTITQNIAPHSAYFNYILVKFNPQGAAQWNSTIRILSPNQHSVVNMGFDSLDNIYVTGVYGDRLWLYPSDSSNAIFLDNPNSYAHTAYLIKYNSSGAVDWQMRNYAQLASGAGGAYSYALEVDPSGNCYMAGSSGCDHVSSTHTFFNTDSTQTSNSVGKYYIAKINPNGICDWIQGVKNDYAYYGAGINISLKDTIVSVVGQIFQNGPLSMSTYFTSADGLDIALTIGKYDYFVATYDTVGNLLQVYTNGENINNNALSIKEGASKGFFQDDAGTYYFAKNIRFFNGQSNYMDFGTNIVGLNETDGAVTKFTTSCGIPHGYCPPMTTSEQINVCAGASYTFPDGTVADSVTSSIFHMSIVPIGNCDSVYNSTVSAVYINKSVSLNGNTLTANQFGVTYQWLDCDNGFTPIAGETSRVLSFTANGNYAVALSHLGCTDTSLCQSVTYTDVKQLNTSHAWAIYPNPTKGDFNLDLGQFYQDVNIRIIDVKGKTLQVLKKSQINSLELSLGDYPTGVYFIQVQTDNEIESFKAIKY